MDQRGVQKKTTIHTHTHTRTYENLMTDLMLSEPDD